MNQLTPIPDPRPNKPDPWHKEIQTRVTLRVDLGDPTPIQIDGDLNFFVVRGGRRCWRGQPVRTGRESMVRPLCRS